MLATHHRRLFLFASLLIGSLLGPALAGGQQAQAHWRRSAVYVIANPAGPNEVLALVRDPFSGRVALKGRYSTGGQGDPAVAGLESHAIVSDGEYLYAVNPGSDTISAFAVRRDGSLQLLGVTPSGGRRPVSLALHDRLLYAINEGSPMITPPPEQIAGSYTGFRVRGNGTLHPIPGSTIPLAKGDLPGELLFNRNGTKLIGARLLAGVIDTFSVRRSGRLEDHAQLGGQPVPFGGSASPVHSDQFFLTILAAPGVASYHLPRSGAPVPITVDVDPTQVFACWATMTGDGTRLWSSSFTPRSLTFYYVDGSGRLSRQSTYTPTSGPGSLDIAVDRAGRFLYQLRGFAADGSPTPTVPQVDVLRITGGRDNGGLALVQSFLLPDELAAAGITGIAVVDP